MERKQPAIKIVDYHTGNMFSVLGACREVGLNAVITSDKNDIEHADALILPGVGAFGEAMNNLRKFDLIGPLRDFLETGKPLLGICLGMQLLFSESEEFGISKGLNFIEGRVRRFPSQNASNNMIRIPHIGWNRITKPADTDSSIWGKSILRDICDRDYMYFIHSFHVIPSDENVTLSVTDYEGFRFCSAVQYRNISATQFHPEKSAQKGIQIYQNWKRIMQEMKEKIS